MAAKVSFVMSTRQEAHLWRIHAGHVALLQGLPMGQLQGQGQIHGRADAARFIILA